MSRMVSPFENAFGMTGDTLPGARLWFYASGTSMPLNTYSDASLTVANTNPAVADSAGRFGPIFLEDTAYKVRLTDADGATVWTADPVVGFISAAAEGSITADAFVGDGLTTVYTLSRALSAGGGAVVVAVDGVVQAPATYAVSGVTLTFSEAPPDGSSIDIRVLGKMVAVPLSFQVGDTTAGFLTWAHDGDGATVAFAIPGATLSLADGYRVDINGVSQEPTASFTVDSVAGTLTFTEAPPDGSRIVVTCLGYPRPVTEYTAHAPGAVARTLQGKLGEVISVKDFGAAGDGVADDTAAVQAAANTGKAVVFPSGKYRVTAQVSLDDVALIGPGIHENDTDGGTYSDDGAVILCTSTADSVFSVTRGVTISGLNFFYPNQVTTGTPTVYPPTIIGSTTTTVTDLVIRDCSALNCYTFLTIGTGASSHGRLTVRNCQIYAIYQAFNVNNLADVLLIDGCMISPGVFQNTSGSYGDASSLKSWTANNGRCLSVVDTDGLILTNSIIYGYNWGLDINGSDTVDLMIVDGCHFDATLRPIVVRDTALFSNATISNCTFHAFNPQTTSATGNASIYITSTGSSDSEITIVGNQFARAATTHIACDNTSLKSLVVVGNSFDNAGWASGYAGTASAVSVSDADADVVVSGNYINNSLYATNIGVNLASVGTAAITGNSLKACQYGINVTAVTTSVAVSGNVSSGTTARSLNLASAAVAAKVRQTGNAFDMLDLTSTHAARSSVLVRPGGAQTFNSGTATDLVLATEVRDVLSEYDTATGIFTALRAGTYAVSLRLTHDNTGTTGDRWAIRLSVSGTGQRTEYRMPAADYNTVNVSAFVALAAGGTVKATVQRTGGAGQFVVPADATLSELTILQLE